MRTFKLLAAIAIPVVLAVPATHAAQSAYPERPIRLVIGSGPGSGPDIVSRALADRLYGAWGQRVIVDSRPGMAGIVAAELVLRAAPDGYTWMIMAGQVVAASMVYPDVKFNLDKDFASISLIGTLSLVLLVTPELPAKSIRELIELAKKTPLRYGSAGPISGEHLAGVLFTSLTGTDILHVPYKGVAQALTDTVGKEVHLTYGAVPAVLGAVQAGRVRALGVTGLKRNALLPDVPSISEVVPGYQLVGSYGVVAPTGTPEAVLAKASAEIAKTVKEPQFGEQLKALGVDLVGSSRAELDAFRREQRKHFSEIVKASGVEVK